MDLSIAKQFVIFKKSILERIALIESQSRKFDSKYMNTEDRISQLEQAIQELQYRDEDTIIKAWLNKLPMDKDGRIKD